MVLEKNHDDASSDVSDCLVFILGKPKRHWKRYELPQSPSMLSSGGES